MPKHYVTAIQRFFCLSIITTPASPGLCIQRTLSNHILLIIPPKNHHCHCHRFLQTRRLDASLTSGRRCSPEVCPFASVGSSWERLWSGNGAVLSNLFADAHDSDFNYHSPRADGWTITRQDLVLLTETRAMLRSSAIGVARAWLHLVYHQLL